MSDFEPTASLNTEGNLSEAQEVASANAFESAFSEAVESNKIEEKQEEVIEDVVDQEESPESGFEQLKQGLQKGKDAGDSKSEESSEELAESKAEAEQGDQEETTDSSAKESNSEEVKTLQASAGDKQLDIPSDATFKHKVDGEEVEVPLQELLNNYSGKVAYDRKFQELDREKQAFTSDKEEVNNSINTFFNLAKQGDELGALDFLLERAGAAYGLDRNTFLNGFAQQVEPQVQQWMQMSEEERAVHQLQTENEYFKRQRESEAQTRTEEQTRKELEGHVSKIQEIHGLDQAQFVEYYDQVVSNPKAIEGLAPNEVLDLVDRYIDNTNSFSEAREILSEVDSSLIANENAIWDFVDTVQTVNKHHGGEFTKEELTEIAKEVYGIDKVANDLSDRVNKNKTSANSKPASPPKRQDKGNRLDEFAEELRNYKSS